MRCHIYCGDEGEPLEEGGAEAEPAAEDEGVVGKLARGDADLAQVGLLWTASGDWAGSRRRAGGRERCGRPELLLFSLPPWTRWFLRRHRPASLPRAPADRRRPRRRHCHTPAHLPGQGRTGAHAHGALPPGEGAGVAISMGRRALREEGGPPLRLRLRPPLSLRAPTTR